MTRFRQQSEPSSSPRPFRVYERRPKEPCPPMGALALLNEWRRTRGFERQDQAGGELVDLPIPLARAAAAKGVKRRIRARFSGRRPEVAQKSPTFSPSLRPAETLFFPLS